MKIGFSGITFIVDRENKIQRDVYFVLPVTK